MLQSLLLHFKYDFFAVRGIDTTHSNCLVALWEKRLLVASAS